MAFTKKVILSLVVVAIPVAVSLAAGIGQQPSGYRFSPQDCLDHILNERTSVVENIVAGPLTRSQVLHQDWQGQESLGKAEERVYFRVIKRTTFKSGNLTVIRREPQTVRYEWLKRKGFDLSDPGVLVSSGRQRHIEIVNRLIHIATGVMEERRGWDVSTLREKGPDYIDITTYNEFVEGGKTVGTHREIKTPYGYVEETNNRKLTAIGPLFFQENFSSLEWQDYMDFIDFLRHHLHIGKVHNNFTNTGMVIGYFQIDNRYHDPWVPNLARRHVRVGRMMMEDIHHKIIAEHYPRGLLLRPAISVYERMGVAVKTGMVIEDGNLYIDPHTSEDIAVQVVVQILLSQISTVLINPQKGGILRYTYGNDLSYRYYRQFGYRKLFEQPFTYQGEDHWFFVVDQNELIERFAELKKGETNELRDLFRRAVKDIRAMLK